MSTVKYSSRHVTTSIHLVFFKVHTREVMDFTHRVDESLTHRHYTTYIGITFTREQMHFIGSTLLCDSLTPFQHKAIEKGIKRPKPIWGKEDLMLCVHDGNTWMISKILHHLKLANLMNNDTCNSILEQVKNTIAKDKEPQEEGFMYST
jgi:hypothetical protein